MDGFDFLGFNIRHYRTQNTKTGYKLLIKPSKEAITRRRKSLKEIWFELTGHNIIQALRKLNPVIRGWANYYRTVVSSKIFSSMDNWMHHRTVRYVKRMHPNKSWKWLYNRYWDKLNKERDDRWLFGHKPSGTYLLKFKWFNIVRHTLIKGDSSPDDPSLRDYFWGRRKVNSRYLSKSDVRLAERQDWRCPVCGRDLIIQGEELHRHHIKPRSEGGSDAYSNRELVHLFCHQQRHAESRKKRKESNADDESMVE